MIWYQFAGLWQGTEDSCREATLLVSTRSDALVAEDSLSGLCLGSYRTTIYSVSKERLGITFGSEDKEVAIALEAPSIRWPNNREMHGVMGKLRVVRQGRHLIILKCPVTFGRYSGLSGECTIYCWRTCGVIEWSFSVTNTRAAKHRGGLWDLGDKRSWFLSCMSVKISPETLPQNVYYSGGKSEDYIRVRNKTLMMYQESSGLRHWRHANHVNRLGRIPMRFAGGMISTAETSVYQQELDPIIVYDWGNTYCALAVNAFGKTFPKAVQLKDNVLYIECFPECAPGKMQEYELQPGERIRLRGVLVSSDNKPDRWILDWCRSPFHAYPQWDYLEQIGFFRQLLVFGYPQKEQWQNYIAGCDIVKELKTKVAEQDEYGWRHYGDIPADHERVYYGNEDTVFVSHYNNQYDLLMGMLGMLLYKNEYRLLPLIHALAEHVADIDIYHTDEDRAAYNHGLFWHTNHYQTAGLATHRSFSRLQKNSGQGNGGGPSCEHLYSTGLYLYYLLTGEPWVREAVIELGNFVLSCDDGNHTVYRWIDRGPTGLASRTRDDNYHGPGRGGGNAIESLLNAWLLSGESVYLEKVRELIRRCFHPGEKIEERNLLDAENRWSYTVFLQAVVRFVMIMLESQGCDETTKYALRGILHYAKWMAVHEYPYLRRQERLEYPTETWPCQDLRKSLILRWAALFEESEWARRMIEKADEISREAWKAIQRFDTRYTTRPLALLLTIGLGEACSGPVLDDKIARFVKGIMQGSYFPRLAKFVPIGKRIWQKIPAIFTWAWYLLSAIFTRAALRHTSDA